MLARLVEQGELPAVAERLPESPLVVEPTDRVGTYGGTWNTALLGAADTPWLGRTVGYEGLMRWNVAWTEAIPNVAESVEQTSDGREFTIRLRAGMKWSDGEPFTADDVVFAWDDRLRNENLTPVMPLFMLSGDEPAEIAKVDDSTVNVAFPNPNGLFTWYLAYTADALVQSPRHYLEQFHADYNPEVDQLVQEEGFADWTELFLAKADVWANKDLPRHHPWILTIALGAGNRVVAERNPYYFKTDPEGSQLPYLDEVIFDVVSDEEVMLLKASNGEIDFHTRHFNTLPNKPVLARDREAGGYDFVTLEPAFENEMIINLNLVHPDPVLREVFQNKDFRIGLSYAIDRSVLIDTAFQGQGEPWQAAPRPDSEFFDEEFAKQYTEYDVDRANEHLDAAGYTERDDEGFRLGPDGERISFAVEVATPAVVSVWPDATQLVVDYWKEVGIDAQMKTEDRSLFYERHEANQHDASVWTGFGGLTIGAILSPRGYLPMHPAGSRFAVPWAQWFVSRGEAGEEPPEPTKQQLELYRQLGETPDEEALKELFSQILAITKEQFYTIGTVMATEGYGIVKNNFHNVPTSMPESHIYNTPSPTNPEQYFIAD